MERLPKNSENSSHQWSVEETNALLALWASTEIQEKLRLHTFKILLSFITMGKTIEFSTLKRQIVADLHKFANLYRKYISSEKYD